MNLERAFHLDEGGYEPAWPLVLGCDLVSRAIWDKKEDKANGITWTFAFLRTLPTHFLLLLQLGGWAAWLVRGMQ